MVFMPPTQVSFCLPLVHVVPSSVIVKGEAQHDTGTDEPQVWIGDPGVIGTEQTTEIQTQNGNLTCTASGNTRENTDSLPFLEEARVLFSVGDRSEASSDPGALCLSQVFIINLLRDIKYFHFRPVMDTYIQKHFAGALAYK